MARRPELTTIPFVLTTTDHGRMIVTVGNDHATAAGAFPGMALTDARSIIPLLEAVEEPPGLFNKILERIAYWCTRYSPVTGIDLPDGIILEATGCCYLWGGEEQYIADITNRCKGLGYTTRVGMADTIGAAWAIAHFGNKSIAACGNTLQALLDLPPAALRLESETVDKLAKFGFHQIKDFIGIPRPALQRRFRKAFIQKLDQAAGIEEEFILPVREISAYEERLSCLEPVTSRHAIEIALTTLLEKMCARLQKEQKGIRTAIFTGFRVDTNVQSVEIGTNSPSHNPAHLFNLFTIKLEGIEPALGFECFLLHVKTVENISIQQEKIWAETKECNHNALSEFLDRVQTKFGVQAFRYLPLERYWPERSVKRTLSLTEDPETTWQLRPRPLLMRHPTPIQVAAPLPDYPPMQFKYNGMLHTIKKSDGPERIEPEWWLHEGGEHRDYYYVEDQQGQRYWLFRLGHYNPDKQNQWFIHGFFA